MTDFEKRTGRFHAARTHGMSKTSIYGIWSGMISRCSDKTNEHYGGRGIKVCDRWLTFENFFADMGQRPPGKSLDRYPDMSGDYEPSNCRWATRNEQAINRCSTRFITAFGETKSISEWAVDKRCAVGVHALYKRIETYKWDGVRAITTTKLVNGAKRRLSIEEIRNIRSLKEAGVRVKVMIGIFNITQGALYRIINRQVWKHV